VSRTRVRPGSCHAGGRIDLAALLLLVLSAVGSLPLKGEDWPMLGRDRSRNAVSPEKGAPLEWDLGTGRSVLWSTPLGDITTSQPVVADGLVWVGTNLGRELGLKEPEPTGVLLCFRARDGERLYYHAATPAPSAAARRRAEFGATASPVVQGDRLWFVTVAAEVLCLDIGPLQRGEGPPKQVWSRDLVREYGVFPSVDVMGGKGQCSLTAPLRNLLHVVTGTGADWSRTRFPSPEAPSLVCLNKDTGAPVWKDASPGTNAVYGEFGHPLVMDLHGVPQVVAPQGDGWVRSFHAETGELLWKLDINIRPVRRPWERNFFLNTPVHHGGRVFVAAGSEVEMGDGPGLVVCLDPSQRGEFRIGAGRDAGGGADARGVVWANDTVGRCLASPVIHDGLVYCAEFGGKLRCLDAATGRELWKHDLGAHIWATPLVVDSKVYLGDEDGDLEILEHGREKKLVFSGFFHAPLYAPAVFANGVLYIASNERLYALRQGARSKPIPGLQRR